MSFMKGLFQGLFLFGLENSSLHQPECPHLIQLCSTKPLKVSAQATSLVWKEIPTYQTSFKQPAVLIFIYLQLLPQEYLHEQKRNSYHWTSGSSTESSPALNFSLCSCLFLKLRFCTPLWVRNGTILLSRHSSSTDLYGTLPDLHLYLTFTSTWPWPLHDLDLYQAFLACLSRSWSHLPSYEFLLGGYEF